MQLTTCWLDQLVKQVLVLILGCVVLSLTQVLAQEKAEPAAEKTVDQAKQPAILLSRPLAIDSHFQGRLALRGLRLDSVKSVTTNREQVKTKLIKSSKTNLPEGAKLELAGDTLLEIELKLPPQHELSEIELQVDSPTGKTSITLPIFETERLVEEQEPNDGFRQARTISLDQTVRGTIQVANDVDVFAIELPADQTMICTIQAQSLGSHLDAHLTLYDDRGRTLAVSDDVGKSRDPRLEYRPIKAGKYYLSLLDPRELGSSDAVYLLQVKSQPTSK